jgi:hypothetical protein
LDNILHPKTSGLQAGGVEQLLENLRLQLLGSAGDTTAIGVVLDADDTPDKRWQQITSVIEKADSGYVIPELPDPTGSIIPAGYAYKLRRRTRFAHKESHHC